MNKHVEIDWHADDVSESEDFDELLLGLEADTIDDETFLRICHETESYDYLIERLLKRGRLEEALVIEWRGRENYQIACQYLTSIRRLYQKLGKSDTWTSYIADLRERNARLPALKDDMAQAKL